MTDVSTSAGRVLITLRQSAPDILAPAGRTLAAINFPTDNMKSSQAGLKITFRQESHMRVSQARTLAAVLGRVADPQLRAWTFSLDGHDFYVLRLGDRGTLVYDVYSEQWMDWSDLHNVFWRPKIGMNWIGGTGLGNTYGSNVLVGDDTYGLLWFLDPDQPYDEHPDYLNPNQEIYFQRITMGQVPLRGRAVMPCFAVWLTTDMGQPAFDGAAVQLEISDDAGETFDDMGFITVTLGEARPELSWYSLGQIEAPGRLFRITDNGAITRIDGMEMNDPDDD